MLMSSVLGGQRAASTVVIGTQKLTEDVAQLMAQGVLSPVIAASLPLGELVAAQEMFENDKPQGVVIVRVSDVDRYPRAEGEADERGQPSVRRLRRSA
jgi:D-arabinose 1-dehydrogenase-like Zn-dependent alcohol dehydrogenase